MEQDPRCRICLSDDEENGRLFSPCLCNGSMQYVHIICLNNWRLSGSHQSNFYECTTCQYRYQFVRLKWAQYLQYCWLPPILTILTIGIIILIGSFVANEDWLPYDSTNSDYSIELQRGLLFLFILTLIIHILVLVVWCSYTYDPDEQVHSQNMRNLEKRNSLVFFVIGVWCLICCVDWVIMQGPPPTGTEAKTILKAVSYIDGFILFITSPWLFYTAIATVIKSLLHLAELRILEVRKAHKD